MTIQELHRDIEKNWSKHLSETRRILKIPSVSATGEGIQDTADAFDRMLCSLGAKTKQFRATRASHPLVYGHVDVGAKRSLAIYGMYDVQPPGKLDEWDYPPFGATVVKRKPYGEILVNRGAYNSKASLVGTVLAVKSMMDRDQNPVNVHFLLEGEEESGGKSLPTFIRKNKKYLSDVDAGVWFDYCEDSRGDVDVALGAKGCVTFDLIAQGNKDRGPMDGQVHSSVAVVVESPVIRLIKAISTFVDEGQNPAIDGLTKDVVPPTRQERELVKKLAKRFSRKAFLDDLSVKKAKIAGTDVALLNKFCFEPSINVAGLLSGYTEDGYSTVLPHRALAKVDIRTVPNMTNEGTRRAVREHLDKHGFKDVTMTRYEDYPWSRVPFDSDVVQASIAALRYHGKDPRIWPSMAGSAPLYIFDEILGIPHCGTGLGSGGGAHAPNEFAVVKGMKDLEKSVVTTFWKFAELSSGHKRR